MADNKRALVIITVMLVAILEVLDSTIVNVALTPMMGGLGANTDQITWVLTSYIVAAAIFMPLTGYFDTRFGRKRFLMTAIMGFMLSSMMCGLTSSLSVMVICRILQGGFGAALVPISQSVMKDSFSNEEQGKAMAIWGIGIMAAPILGPTLGGYIIEHSTWRWIFYLNVPICLISLLLTAMVIPTSKAKQQRTDWLGMAIMATGIGCLQLFLDQGNSKGWLTSNFILCLLTVSITALAIFIIRGLRKSDNIINLRLFTNRNLTITTIGVMLTSAGLSAMLAMQPILMQRLMNYPAIASGMVMAPRGLACAIGMIFVPSLMKRIGDRWVAIIGFLLCAFGSYQLCHLNLLADQRSLMWPGVIQGLGMGMIMVPLASNSLKTLPKHLVAAGSGIFGYGRMLGASIGISIVSTIVTRETQINWNRLSSHLNNTNPNLHQWLNQQHLTLHNPIAIHRLAQTLAQQANMVAFIDGFYAIAIAFLLGIPLVFFLTNLEKN